MISIALANQKGGVGKTTLTQNLGYELGIKGFKVCLIDLDPQASLSKGILGETTAMRVFGLDLLFINDVQCPTDFLQPSKMPNVSLVPTNQNLAGVHSHLLLKTGNEEEKNTYRNFYRLKDIVDKLTDFDIVLIDAPPSLGFLTLNGFIASKYVIIPVNPGYYSLLGVNDLSATIAKVQKKFNPDLEILGVVLTMMDRRPIVVREVEDEVRSFFNEKVFDTVTSRTVKTEEAGVSGVGISELYPKSKSAKEYQSLTKEILNRLGL